MSDPKKGLFRDKGPDLSTLTREELEAEVRRLTFHVQRYRQRADLMQACQVNMRDPERTIVCDILANGSLLPDPAGTRYGGLIPPLPGKTRT